MSQETDKKFFDNGKEVTLSNLEDMDLKEDFTDEDLRKSVHFLYAYDDHKEERKARFLLAINTEIQVRAFQKSQKSSTLAFWLSFLAFVVSSIIGATSIYLSISR